MHVKMVKKKVTKIAAIIALIAMFGSIIWTWILIIFETYFSSNKQDFLSQNELNELLKNYSWSLTSSWTFSWSWVNTWTNDNTLTWTIK